MTEHVKVTGSERCWFDRLSVQADVKLELENSFSNSGSLTGLTGSFRMFNKTKEDRNGMGHKAQVLCH
jgi:hypothetical protein